MKYPKRPHEYTETKDDESHNQRAFFVWVNVAARWGLDVACDWSNRLIELPPKPGELVIEGLLWAHHNPNGGLRNPRVANTLKSEGVKRGIWDVFIPIPTKDYHGLYIEFKAPGKRPKRNGKGGLSDDQIEFGLYGDKTGYSMQVAYSWEEGVQIVIDYLD